MEFRSLASGSSGNSFLVRKGRAALLIDAGLSGRRLHTMLEAEGVVPGDLLGIALTHEHSDHVRGVQQLAARYSAPVFTSRGTFRALGSPADLDWRAVAAGAFTSIGPFELLPIGLPHDAAEPLAFRVSAGPFSVAVATDFGHATDELCELLETLDLLVLEANHDEDWLWRGSYPWSLKKRVSGEFGHISNETAAAILTRLYHRAPRSVWLAHLSKHNNDPDHALRTITAQLRRQGIGDLQLTVAERDRPSLRWRSDSLTQQLALGF